MIRIRSLFAILAFLLGLAVSGPVYAQIPSISTTQADQQAAQDSAAAASARSNIAATIERNLSLEWLAPSIKQIAVSSETFAQQAFQKFAGPVSQIVSLLFATWITVQAVRIFLGRTDIGTFLWSLATRSGALIIVCCLLGVGSYGGGNVFWNGFVVKPVQMTASVSTTLLNMAGYSAKCNETDFAQIVGCIEDNIDSEIKQGVGAGLLLAFVPDWPGALHPGALGIRLMSLLSGLLVAVVYGVALIYFSLFILDLIFVVCLISALAPFFIGAFLLDYTRPWAVSCLNRLIGDYVSIVSVSLAVAILGKVMDDAAPVAGQEAGLSGVSTWQQFAQQAGSIHVQATQWLLNPTDPGYLALLFAGVALMPLTKTARNLFSQMLGGHGGEGVGSALGGKAAAFVAGAATTAAMPQAKTLKAAYGLGKSATSKAAGAAVGVGRSGYRMGRTIQRARGLSGLGVTPKAEGNKPIQDESFKD